jgi:hypothetical protein
LTFATSTVDASGNSLGVMVMDVNHDGFNDVVKSYSNNGTATSTATYINQNAGRSWKLDSGWNAPMVFVNGTTDQGVRSDDADGNGGPDLVEEQYLGTTQVYLNKTGYADLLSSITFPHGAQEKVGYTSTAGTGLAVPIQFGCVNDSLRRRGEYH